MTTPGNGHNEQQRTVAYVYGTEPIIPREGTFDGGEFAVDETVFALEALDQPKPREPHNYVIEETATYESAPGRSGVDHYAPSAVELNEGLLQRVRPDSSLWHNHYDGFYASWIARHLKEAGLTTCADVLEQGIVGLYNAGLDQREAWLVSALTRKMTKNQVTLFGQPANQNNER